ncbi:MAG: hypothetical protein B7X94_02665 [Hydrogenophilales bacterium 17-62-8]|nr:MAG: hypothetical protein B7X94_02665 [Hydrogenophilales bacterium 17-62-8]
MLVWWKSDWFISIGILLLGYILFGILRSKLRNDSIPVSQREYEYTDYAIGRFIDRKLTELSPVERSILLIGAYELLHCPDVPMRVVINESVELAKTFGGIDGHKYINGVLDKLAQEMRAVEAGQPRRGKP